MENEEDKLRNFSSPWEGTEKGTEAKSIHENQEMVSQNKASRRAGQIFNKSVQNSGALMLGYLNKWRPIFSFENYGNNPLINCKKVQSRRSKKEKEGER